MTWDEYLDFLDQYWELYGPPPPRPLADYKDVKL